MSGQRARPAVPADHRSAHPNFPGVPWWGAVLIAIVAALIGFAFDAGSGAGQLTGAFSTLYVIGCVAAVLAVRQHNIFTAVIQPPLILFVVVPGAYFLMHNSEIHGIKDILINCGYPLIERFPLMFFTAVIVLAIGVARWFLGRSARRDAPSGDAAPDERRTPAKTGWLAAKLASVLGEGRSDEDGAGEPRRRHSADRRRTTSRAAADRAPRGADPSRGAERGSRRSAAPSRSRHTRPPDTEIIEPVVDRPRRRRPRPTEAPAAEPRRRSRSSSERQRRSSIPPSERRASYDRPDRADRPERAERPERDRSARSPRPRPQRPNRYDGFEPLEPHNGNAVYNGTHHPVSRVRYRGEGDTDEDTGYRPRRRAPREFDADRWEYDI